jgi:hypothetical protein
MATRRYSLAPEGNDHQITDAVGSATVTAAIEVTIDWDTLISTYGLSHANAKRMALDALQNITNYIETSGWANFSG